MQIHKHTLLKRELVGMLNDGGEIIVCGDDITLRYKGDERSLALFDWKMVEQEVYVYRQHRTSTFFLEVTTYRLKPLQQRCDRVLEALGKGWIEEREKNGQRFVLNLHHSRSRYEALTEDVYDAVKAQLTCYHDQTNNFQVTTRRYALASPLPQDEPAEETVKLYVQCRDMGTIRRCRVKLMKGGISLEYHNFYTVEGNSYMIEPVFILTSEDNEADELYDGRAWDLDAVQQFVRRHAPLPDNYTPPPVVGKIPTGDISGRMHYTPPDRLQLWTLMNPDERTGKKDGGT